MRKIILFFISLLFVTNLLSQTCSVDMEPLKGQYTGACKDGKADGIGTATGTDTYSGNFKHGYPDGFGKYTWKNGTSYEGFWKNGLLDGEGTFKEFKEKDSLSVIKGFWKKGKYTGKYEKPFTFQTFTNNVTDVSIRKLNKTASEITLNVKTITGGASSLSANQLPKAKLVDIQIIDGRFQQQIPDELSSNVANKYIFRGVTFPFHAIFSFETGNVEKPVERVGIDFLEDCSWLVQINIDN